MLERDMVLALQEVEYDVEALEINGRKSSTPILIFTLGRSTVSNRC